MKYTIILNPDRTIVHEDLSQAISCFYRSSMELTSSIIEFYEDSHLLFTWVRGKGIIEKRRGRIIS